VRGGVSDTLAVGRSPEWWLYQRYCPTFPAVLKHESCRFFVFFSRANACLLGPACQCISSSSSFRAEYCDASSLCRKLSNSWDFIHTCMCKSQLFEPSQQHSRKDTNSKKGKHSVLSFRIADFSRDP